jgi:hypothetical protein
MAAPVVTPLGAHVLDVEGVRLEVEPRVGGRVTSFRLGEAEILTGRDVHPTNWGSTLWTSPQSDWGWPPPPAFDDAAYVVEADPEAIALSGPPDGALGVALLKRFSADAATRSIVVEHGVRNVGMRPRSLALWEVSRVPARGLTFFPTGATAAGSLGVQRVGPATWYLHDPGGLTSEGAKIVADGTGGFVAHVVGRVLFVKSFTDLAPEAQAPGEGEVEIYANDRYVEVEAQGPYVTVAPGATARWTVRWSLRQLPADVRVEAGNDALLAFACRTADEMRG